MSSDLEKFLAKVNVKERKVLFDVLSKILDKNIKGLDIKKLSGAEDIFRVRKGAFRIIFKVTKTDIKIVTIERRSDTTYNL